jgi:hypothetical protein
MRARPAFRTALHPLDCQDTMAGWTCIRQMCSNSFLFLGFVTLRAMCSALPVLSSIRTPFVGHHM